MTTLRQLDETTWEIPRQGAMRVPGRIIADERLLPKIQSDKTADQVANVACLPGIVRYALAMPDAHWGYGFPIGGVAATDPDNEGVVSPGGVGYDINCGVRLMTTQLTFDGIRDCIRSIITNLYHAIPSGVGSSGAIRKLGKGDLKGVLEQGSRWVVDQGYGTDEDLEATEESGCMVGADASAVSDRALSRGADQLGTLGSGNHFAELGIVEQVFDNDAAAVFGLAVGGITVMIHSGSRGLGYQVCDDALVHMRRAAAKYRISLPDRQLCCAPVHAPEGRQYLAAMAAAANFAWANRQVMTALSRRSLCESLGITERELSSKLLYDVCHNIAKFEVHDVEGTRKRLCVHRKGATRAFSGSRSETPAAYRSVGQPVLVPGDMGTASYVCAGTDRAMNDTFGSICHGAGRMMSRSQARKRTNAAELVDRLQGQGIIIMAQNKRTITEEGPDAYKNVDDVVEVIERAGIGRRIARIRPLGVVKG